MTIESLFPLKGEITQEILDTANRGDCKICVGALTLKAAMLGKNANFDGIRWMDIYGWIDPNPNIDITTLERVHMMEVDKPQTVTFILNPNV